MARFTDLRSDTETISQVLNQRNLVNRVINRTLARIYGSHPWPFALDEAFFTTVDDYSTGTVTVTNGSTTVMGASTVFTDAIVGRKIRVGSDNAYYRISAFVSTTELTLEAPYQGSLTSGNTYVVYQDEYRLRADVDVQHFYRQVQQGIALTDVDPGDFDINYPTQTAFGDPTIIAPIGTRRDIYSTGTVSASSKTITGVSTAWTDVQGLSRGSRIRIGDNVYTVKSVDSATQLTVFETVTTVAAGQSYVIFLDNIRVILKSIPDAARNIYYRFYRKPTPLVNDYDEPDLPETMQYLLPLGSLTELYQFKNDVEKSLLNEKEFEGGIQKWKVHYRSQTRVYQRFPQGSSTRSFQPRFPQGTDIRAHAP